MKTLCIFLFFLFLELPLWTLAQEMHRDSLKKQLYQEKNPQQRVNLLIHILDLSGSDKDDFDVATQLYKEAKAIGDKFAIATSLGSITIGWMQSPTQKDSLFCLLKEADSLLKNSPEDGIATYYGMVYQARVLSLTERAHRMEICNQILDELNQDKEKENAFQQAKRLFLTGSIYYLLMSLTENTENEGSVPYLEEAWQLAQTFPPSARKNFSANIYILLSNLYSNLNENQKLIKLSNAYLDMLDEYFAQDVIQKRRPYFYKDNLYLLCYQQLMVNHKLIGKEKAREYYHRFYNFMKNGKGDILQRDNLYFYSFSYSYFMNQGEYEQALACSDSLIYLIEKNKISNIKYVTHYKNRAEALIALGRYKDACNAYERTMHIADSLQRKEQLKTIGELQVSDEMDKLKLSKARLSARNHTIALISAITLLCLLIGFALYLYLNLKRTQKLHNELLQQREKALKSEKQKNAFINSICHEVRTPLNSISGFTALIVEDMETNGYKNEYNEIIQESCDHLTNLLDDMLEVAYLENLNTDLPTDLVDINKLCKQEMEAIQKKYPQKEVVYKLYLSPQLSPICTHAKYFSLLIRHLLNNARKFTQTGEIQLKAEPDQKNKKINITITDTGCGIPKDKQEYVFERFTKLDTFTPGNGLGLYLCRLISIKLHATLYIDAHYMQGTRIVFCWANCPF